jgi:regulator of protease activity HflC (stomatin/prohibitin superfamily)
MEVTMKPSKTKSSVLLLMIITLMVPLLFTGCGTQVPSGHHGVKYFKFKGGTEMGKVYQEGFNWHMPWNSIYVYQTQLQERQELLDVLSSDGATIQLEVSVWYRPIVTKLDSLQVTIGPNYYNVVIAPALRGIARTIVGRYKPEQIYSTKREEISTAIIFAMDSLMKDKFINVDNTIVRNVVLPRKISEAINEKLSADQEQQRMEFTILKERQEADRKVIEAEGIKKFQEIVSAGLTKDFLRWKGIETTEKLAASPNAKVIVIGAGADGLPLILGGQ